MDFAREWNFDEKPDYVEDLLIRFLRENGYFIVASIDVRDILQKNFNEDIGFFHILEICKPIAAMELLHQEKLSGLLVPCKGDLIERDGKTIFRLIQLDEISEKFLPETRETFEKYQNELNQIVERFHSSFKGGNDE